MARTFGTFVVIALLGVAGSASAAQTTTAAKKAAPSTAKAKAPAKATALVTSGKIVKFDSNMLVVSTAKGDQSFPVDSSARLQEGTKTIMASDLSSLTGRTVKVSYTESAGKKTVQSVRVDAAKAKSTTAKAAPKTTTAKKK